MIYPYTCNIYLFYLKKKMIKILVEKANYSLMLSEDSLKIGQVYLTESLFFSVLCLFQDYFSSYETGQSVGGQKRENPEKNHLAHLQAELGLSHMWPVQSSNRHQTQQ